ncbi:MAG: RNA polymerase sporulation sigma factor SigH [Lachnospiraceae bacterium]|nr:RNA polymerase sporulation sigma factor SigH [Lachnospiraceae bacterium]
MAVKYGEYQNISDEELIDRLRQGEEPIMEYICTKYKEAVRRKAKTMYILGGERDDLIQEGMVGVFKAVRDYDSGRDASFATFADLCISRQMYTAVQAADRQKHIPLNSYVSLYTGGLVDGEGETREMLEQLEDREKLNPEELFLDKERVADMEQKISRELSGFEKQVLDLYLTGMNYTEIAKVLDRDSKSTDNALQRIRNKLKKIF